MPQAEPVLPRLTPESGNKEALTLVVVFKLLKEGLALALKVVNAPPVNCPVPEAEAVGRLKVWVEPEETILNWAPALPTANSCVAVINPPKLANFVLKVFQSSPFKYPDPEADDTDIETAVPETDKGSEKVKIEPLLLKLVQSSPLKYPDPVEVALLMETFVTETDSGKEKVRIEPRLLNDVQSSPFK